MTGVKVLALDLERTLISDAMNREPRPGLAEFLRFCCDRFPRVALFTSVDEKHARAVIADLEGQGYIPPELTGKLEYVRWDGRYKDLAYVPGVSVSDVLLVDDDEGWIKPEQKSQWIGIQEWDPYLVTGEDQELVRIRGLLEDRLSQHGVQEPMGVSDMVEWRANVPEKFREDPAFAFVRDDPRLPRVLLIGDSISIGYTAPVRALLAGKANVHRIPDNGDATGVGLAKLDAWLGERRWDVIHFNWGLHDLKHWKDGKLDLAGPQVTPLEAYEKNLRELIARLQATGAKLIWASTTPVPAGAAGRVPGDEIRYNAVARKVMREKGVAIHDLHAFVAPQLGQMQQPRNVHFTPRGYEALARQVADAILRQL